MTDLLTPRSAPAGVYSYDLTRIDWSPIEGKDGAYQKAVDTDRDRGMFVGLVAMDEMTNTGLHVHTGPATNYFLRGALTDWVMEQSHGDFVINPTGAMHDAFCIASTVFVGKLDGPLRYAADEVVFNMNNNPLQGDLENTRPEEPADIVLTMPQQRPTTTLIAGLSRKVLWDYAGEVMDGRVTKFQLLPRTQLPRHQLTGMTHWFILGGELEVNGQRHRAGSFLVLEPMHELDIRTSFGAMVLAWADGPVSYMDEDTTRPDLYGF